MSKRRRTYCIGLSDGSLCGETHSGRRHRMTTNVRIVTCAVCLVQMDRTLEAQLATIEQRDVPTYVMRQSFQRVEPLWEYVFGIDATSYTFWRSPVESWTWDEGIWSGNAQQGP